MSDIGLLTQLSSLGLGAVIAIIVLLWKRADDQAHRDELAAIIARMEARDERMLAALESTALALQSLQETVESLSALNRLEERIIGLETRLGRR